MRRGVTLPVIFSAVGVLWLVIAAFGQSWWAIIAFGFLVIGALLHRRRNRRRGARYASDRMAPDDRLVSRPGLRDRYEGVVDSLLRW